MGFLHKFNYSIGDIIFTSDIDRGFIAIKIAKITSITIRKDRVIYEAEVIGCSDVLYLENSDIKTSEEIVQMMKKELLKYE